MANHLLTERRRGQAVVLVGVVVALCLAAGAICAASQPVVLSWPLPFGYVMSVCAVFSTTPVLEFGLFWMSPFFSSALPPHGGLAAGCLAVPWLPMLPQRGEWLYSP
jgi:hypothetical protein